ncbi:hypothetical protein [Vibrio marisflavi]|uniref:Uncharacterized protein n=1 Tax=Vibrio marisflavi CECT 7928 TaxID=634439 RepID=A0ABN8DYS5_9VIBR|nr:hypothetical protein [Vibrio marisflavi]CAH0536718.1 hypothetical protein VMF7928_00645 [Vibrio marisflavi CECT 7928]
MNASQIVIPKSEASEPKQAPNSKVAEAYINERNKLEYTEVELSRAKVVVLDEDGNVSHRPIFLDH